jgi:hypothetical protein
MTGREVVQEPYDNYYQIKDSMPLEQLSNHCRSSSSGAIRKAGLT